MGLTFNGKTPESITIGGKAVASLSINGDVVWPEIPSEPDYFYVDLGASSSPSNYIVLKKVGSPTTGSDIQYGIWNPQIPPSGGIGWVTVVFDSNNECIINKGAMSSGGKIYFRSTTGWSTNYNNYYYFSEASRSFNIGGDMRTLIDYSDLSLDSVPASCFLNLFRDNSSIKSAEYLDFSKITNLAPYCYQDMFYGCTSLTTAPTLPATTLADYCYQWMFYGCTSLTTAPTLPATTLALYCYRGMFSGCNSLTTPPTLNATTLAQYCYYEMFRNCTSLTTAPTLPATTLAQRCYQNMFYGCTSLTTAPTLPATTLAKYCYYEMFRNCTSLNKVITYAQDISAASCLYYWLSGVAATGDFYNLGGATYSSSVSGIPSGWTVHTSL